MWLSKESLDNNDTLAEKIKNKPSTSAPNSSLSILGKKFKDDGGTIEKVLIQGTVEANREYPVEFTIRRKGIEKTFTCNIGFFDHTSDDGKILAAKYNIQCKKWDFREDGIYVLYETSVVYPYGVAIDGWTSSNEELISIQNSNKAEVRFPKIGVEQVVLTASLSLGDKKDFVERTVTLDSGRRVGTYVATVCAEDENTVLSVDCKEAESPDGIIFEYGQEPAYQWYRMPIGSDDPAEIILGATNETCELRNEDKTGAYWYYCKVTNKVAGQPDKASYSNFVRVTFTDTGIKINGV